MNREQAGLVEAYLQRLARGMRGASKDVAREAEREIRAHIEDALGALPAQSPEALMQVLERLGRPEDYGRDMALFMMVDRGYRERSLPHMLRSTLFWALTTVTGAVVVLAFGLLFAAASGLLLLGGLGLRGAAGGAVAWSAGGQLIAGLLALLALPMSARWFVGQYVRHAVPGSQARRADREDWARRTERRILVTAAAGFALSLAAGLASGGFTIQPGEGLVDLLTRLRPSGATPWAWLCGLGLLLLGLAPLIGVAWSALRQGSEPEIDQ
ncbi:MAG: hypothetical protein H6648_10600 [Caldilineae bacterium]|nr:hypothetical protein [Caldilineae bacterium]